MTFTTKGRTSVASAAAFGVVYLLFPILFALTLETSVPKRYLQDIHRLLKGTVWQQCQPLYKIFCLAKAAADRTIHLFL